MLYIQNRYFLIKVYNKIVIYLIGIREATHTTHDTEDIVVYGVDFEGTIVTYIAVFEVKNRIIDSREVTGTTGLMLFGFESERVYVGDTVVKDGSFGSDYERVNHKIVAVVHHTYYMVLPSQRLGNPRIARRGI